MEPNKVIIAGGGLVGSLAGCYFAKRGWTVEVYEKRPDPRAEANKGSRNHKSINLAISARGLSAVERLGPATYSKVKSITLPMYGRMIHDIDGKTLHGQAYSAKGEYINSIDRGLLNHLLLDQLDDHGKTARNNVKVVFDCILDTCDFKTKTARFRNQVTGEVIETKGDLIVGADGAYSVARRRLQSATRVNIELKYIDHLYCELEMKPKIRSDNSTDFAMQMDHLHIWPRGTFMLIALPNLDKSFTCTLFMPLATFESLKTPEDLSAFFRKYFPDALELFGGEETIAQEYFANPKGDLFYVKCSPHHYKGNGVIVGDAAHCTVPFYAQGMNCGFEDIETLDRLLVEQAKISQGKAAETGDDSDIKTHNLTPEQIEAALIKYSDCRPRDSASMIDLALHNYVEMRNNVNKLSYKLRFMIEKKLSLWFPSYVMPLYSMVSFSKLSYTEATRRWNAQTRAINRLVTVGTEISAICIAASLVCIVSALSRRGYAPFARLNGLRIPKLQEIFNLFRSQ
ncbi:Kynurenine 3-monooxygenase [Zancudomyces culisetae]|uniref:Kynurenine 3-monooxygenase n=1 Tax=Zancudomyces culisetae TaxID=1213189 RepID=A0A1R1PZ61_ZANCU|nr:Kynurenine 3-monooxygenase [Zancudomyces culisetae]|eukprot:OMH86229.1 Kynurenine 3-monooxygenase [Zancudomyces culisetae]